MTHLERKLRQCWILCQLLLCDSKYEKLECFVWIATKKELKTSKIKKSNKFSISTCCKHFLAIDYFLASQIVPWEYHLKTFTLYPQFRIRKETKTDPEADKEVNDLRTVIKSHLKSQHQVKCCNTQEKALVSANATLCLSFITARNYIYFISHFLLSLLFLVVAAKR